MKRFIIGLAAAAAVVMFVGCAGLVGRGRGPVEAFTFQAEANPGLSTDVAGTINTQADPKEITLVVPVGTDMHGLVATLSLLKEAEIAVVSSGTRVVQQNGVTPNDFSLPVTYAITVAGEKQPWTYRVFVRESETNARLQAIVGPQGSILRPFFSPTVREYSLEVPFAAQKVRIEARGATRTIRSVTIDAVESAGSSGAAVIDFTDVQERPVIIRTLAEDGVTRDQYIVTILRGMPDSNSSLAALSVADAPLAPAFSPGQLSYRTVVPFETGRLVVHARPQSAVASAGVSATIIFNRAGTSSAVRVTGNPASPAGALVDFTVGDGLEIVVQVTAEDQSVRQYLVEVMRAAPDGNNLLSGLSLEVDGRGIPMTPIFGPLTPAYLAEVPYSARRVAISARTQSRFATVSLEPAQIVGSHTTIAVAGDPQSPSGAAIDLPAGVRQAAFFLRVEAQDGGIQRYTLQIIRAQPDRNASLALLTASVGALTPPFAPGVMSYALVVPAAADSVTIRAQAASPAATVDVAGQPGVMPGVNVSLTLAIAQGSTAAMSFTVTAEDGSQRLYRLQVTREGPPAPPPQQDGNTLLQSLSVDEGRLVPPFNPSIVLYDVRIPADVRSFVVTAVPQSRFATVTIDGLPVQGNSRRIAWQPNAARTVLVDVKAQNGTQARYALRLVGEEGPAEPPESDTGGDHVLVSARNLRLQQREASELSRAGDQVGTQARITVRYYRTNQVITQYTVPVEVKQQGGVPSVTLSYRSNGITMSRDRLVEVETAIPTSRGKYLSYTEAQAADGEVSVDIPFLVYGSDPRIQWPAVGRTVHVAGYISKLPLTRDRAADREELEKNGRGEYSIDVEISDANSGAFLGRDTISVKPGQGRDRTLSFGHDFLVAEGATVKCVLTAKAKNGTTWSATDTTQVWTTKMDYPSGFMPVFIFVSDDLVPKK